MSISTGVVAAPKPRSVEDVRKDCNRITVLERANVRYYAKIEKNKADIHNLKSGLGVA